MDKVSICVVGAGYGGSIMAARLAEVLNQTGQAAKHKIWVLEKGYDFHNFDPKGTHKERNEFGVAFKHTQDPAYQSRIYSFYNDLSPESLLSGKPTMRIAAGKGVGGGSLINGAASLRAPTESFFQTDDSGRKRWPSVYTRAALDPYYAKVEQFLNVQKLSWTKGGGPDWAVATRRDYVFAQGCLKAGYTAQPIRVALKNCVNCGWCYTGCPFNAKSAIDYPSLAKALGAEFHTQCDVLWVAPAGAKGGYVVEYRDGRSGNAVKQLECQILVLSAGSVGTSGILLRSQYLDKFTGTRGLGEQVGRNLSASGDHFLGGIVGPQYQLNNYQGKVVNASTFSFWKDHRFIIESFSLQPWLAVWGLPAQMSKADKPAATGRNSIDPTTPLWGHAFKQVLVNHASRVMSMLVLGIDQAEGRVALRGANLPLGLAKSEIVRNNLVVPSVEWPKTHPKTEQMWATAVTAARKIYEALDGEILADTYRDQGVVTGPHSVGGCVMADSKAHGVCDANGEVFDNPNLFIADGSVMPPIGVNPYLSIAAVAERNAELLQKSLLKRLA